MIALLKPLACTLALGALAASPTFAQTGYPDHGATDVRVQLGADAQVKHHRSRYPHSRPYGHHYDQHYQYGTQHGYRDRAYTYRHHQRYRTRTRTPSTTCYVERRRYDPYDRFSRRDCRRTTYRHYSDSDYPGGYNFYSGRRNSWHYDGYERRRYTGYDSNHHYRHFPTRSQPRCWTEERNGYRDGRSALLSVRLCVDANGRQYTDAGSEYVIRYHNYDRYRY
ncbi:hypothetical protein [Maricaulis sp. CAU 1757]